MSTASPPSEPPRPTEVFHALKWSALGEASSRLIAPAVFLILARLLTPEDFGVVAAATVLISLCQALADAGLGKALVQRGAADDTGNAVEATCAFWVALAVSTALALVLAAGAPAIAVFFGDGRIQRIVWALAILVPLTGAAAIPTALLQRRLAFRELFWVRLVTATLPALASIPMALSGLGYWALVAGTVAGQGLQCGVLWWRAGWLPKIPADLSAARALLRFGRWSAFSALLAWGYTWLDALFVARYLGAHDMGLYRIANTFVAMVFGLAFAPLLPVLYSFLSRSSNRPDQVADSLATTAKGIVYISMPLGALILLLSPLIEVHLFGAHWQGLAPVIGTLAMGQGFAWLVGANGEAYRAVGKPEWEAWTMGIALLVYTAAYAIAARYGLIAFAWTRVLLVVVGIALHIYAAHQLLAIRPSAWIRMCVPPAAATLVASAVARCLKSPTDDLQAWLLVPVTFLAAYVVCIAFLDRAQLRWLHRSLFRTSRETPQA